MPVEGCGGTSSSNWQACQAKDESTCEADNCAGTLNEHVLGITRIMHCRRPGDVREQLLVERAFDDGEYDVIQIAAACETEYSVTDLDLIAKARAPTPGTSSSTAAGIDASGHSPSCPPTTTRRTPGARRRRARLAERANTADGVYYARFDIQFDDASQLRTLLLWGGDLNYYSCGAWRGGFLASTGAMAWTRRARSLREPELGIRLYRGGADLGRGIRRGVLLRSVNSVARMWTCMNGCGSHEVQEKSSRPRSPAARP